MPVFAPFGIILPRNASEKDYGSTLHAAITTPLLYLKHFGQSIQFCADEFPSKTSPLKIQATHHSKARKLLDVARCDRASDLYTRRWVP
jgi:hypothetical protein